MRTFGMKSLAVVGVSLLTIACGEAKKETVEAAPAQENHADHANHDMHAMHNDTPAMAASGTYKKGDAVPSDLVCMVNDAYMGNKQLEVEVEGKMYYGCCEMCKTRIPQDAAVRAAVDPYTLKSVDKATAYIVIIGNNGEVAYFENEDNYKKFVAEGKQG
ncbi:hypothetical protein HX017_03260 [Myroides marinus]|uniref:MlpB protein n=1 Tax=Myroides marinus TaxID=703342 RepID=A0A1H6V1E5_9FLAO|nr:hypothetical protein [Myroides marinus]MDR0193820.1 hypothetical protein [Myroides sp.]KUF43481.1 hypothetical protein AS361_11235 [Myroides marinus]MDM1346090.1 hypothetical protein [Myroides marinus]MDM1350858.1 hypothetical protein [Myroides marinus]MDM1353344.1 hypothetical protein [Myroides marinus]